MAVTGFGPVVTLPLPRLRPRGLFVQNADRVDMGERFPLGVQWQPFDFSALLFNDSDCSPVDLPSTTRDFPDVEEQPAFSIWDSVSCSSLWKTPEEMEADIEARWPRLLSHALAIELLSGSASGGTGLEDVDQDLGATGSVLAAVAEAEEVLALNLRGSQGMLHMAPSLLSYAVTNGTVVLRDNTYYTAGGHIVIADSGYQSAETTTSKMFVTGPVYYDLAERQSLATQNYEDFNFSRNIKRQLEMTYAILLFDPNTVWSTVVTK